MGGSRTSAARPEGLTPSSALTVAEAASLAGVDRAEIEARIADGALLSERSGARGRGKALVRLFDLADVYPSVMGRVGDADGPASGTGGGPASGTGDGPASDAGGDPASDEAGAPAPEEAAAPASDGGGAANGARDDAGSADGPSIDTERLVPRPDAGGRLAQDTGVQSAPRGALIQLCEDLETRLDLAERERQASTASLLMAQRRVLDLEAGARRAPWRGATLGAALLLSIGAVFVAVRAPGRAAAAVREELSPVSARIEAQLLEVRGDAVARASALEGAIADLGRAARESSEEDGARIDALAATLSAELERARESAARTEDAVAAALAEDSTRRAAALAALRAEDVEARERLEARLGETEAVLRASREALVAERDGRAADARSAAEANAALTAAIERLEARMEADRLAIDALRAEVEAGQRARSVEPEATPTAAPEGAIQRLLDAARAFLDGDRS